MIKYLLLFLSLSAFSQQKAVDSLMRIYNNANHDTTKLAAINDVLNYVTQEEATVYNDKMLRLAIQNLGKTKQETLLFNKYLTYAVEGYYLKGVFASNNAQYDSALFYSDKAIEIDPKKQNEELIVNCQITKANIYTNKGLFTISSNLLYQALKYFDRVKNYEGAGDAYQHIAGIHFAQRDFKKSIVLYEKSYANYKLVNYYDGMIEVLKKLALCSRSLENHEETIKYLNRSILLAKQVGNKDINKQQQMLNSSLGYLEKENKNYRKAIDYFTKSISQAKTSNNTYVLSPIYLAIAKCFYYENNYDAALINANKAMNIAVENNNLQHQKSAASFFAFFYKNTSNYKLALNYNELHSQLKDSLQKLEEKKTLMELGLKYDYEKKELISNINHEREIIKLNGDIEKENSRKNSWIIGSVAAFLVLIIISIFVNKQQKDKNIIEIQNSDILRQKMLLSQMNPHFVFNSINSIQSFILDKKEKEAYSYLAKFSKLIRMVLNNTEELVIPLFQEIDLLKTYIELEQLRFEKTFEYELNINDDINEQGLFIPPMLIQPYVENAIWHGLMNLENERIGKLRITVNTENNLLKIVIEDNGIGRSKSALYEKESIHKPIAMKVTEKRLQMINKAWGKDGIKVTIHDLFDENEKAIGTKVEVFLPLDLQEHERA